MTRALAIVLLWGGAAAAEPCGDVPLEGRCDGSTRVYCAATPEGPQLKSEPCDACCGWQGQRYDCLETCPAGCIEECKQGPDVFGCSLMNTHAFTCEVSPEGCTRRVYVACADTEVCDESETHTCRPRSEVDLCGGVPASGVCQGHVFKRCVAGAIEATDCADLGQGCAPGGCTSECTPVCLEGESGCFADGRAWSCVPDAVTGCLVQVGKNCGAKTCHQGACVFPSEIPPEDPPAPESTPDAGAAGPPETTGGGCLIAGDPDDGLAESTLAVLATLLGFLIFLMVARRRDNDRRAERRRSERGPGGHDGAPT